MRGDGPRRAALNGFPSCHGGLGGGGVGVEGGEEVHSVWYSCLVPVRLVLKRGTHWPNRWPSETFGVLPTAVMEAFATAWTVSGPIQHAKSESVGVRSACSLIGSVLLACVLAHNQRIGVVCVCGGRGGGGGILASRDYRCFSRNQRTHTLLCSWQ